LLLAIHQKVQRNMKLSHSIYKKGENKKGTSRTLESVISVVPTGDLFVFLIWDVVFSFMKSVLGEFEWNIINIKDNSVFHGVLLIFHRLNNIW